MYIKIREERAAGAERGLSKKLSAARGFAQMALLSCLCIGGSSIPAFAYGCQDLIDPELSSCEAPLEGNSQSQSYTIRSSVLGARHTRQNPNQIEFDEPRELALGETGLPLSEMGFVIGSKPTHLQLASSRHFHGRYRSGGFSGYRVQKRWMRPTNKGFSASRGYGRFYGSYQNFDGSYYRGPRRGAEYFIGGVVTQDGRMNCKYGNYCTIYLGGPKIITRNGAGDIIDGELVEPIDK